MSSLDRIFFQFNSLFSISKGQNYALLLFLLFFLVIGYLSMQDKAWTYDEKAHFRYGGYILNGSSNRFDDSKMPVTAWNVLPAKIARFLPIGSLKTYFEDLPMARLMTILFSTVIAFMVFHWSRKLYGVIPAFVSLTLYVLDPNIIAHSQLVTTDVYMMGMMLVSCYWLWRFANSRKARDLWMFSLMLALAQLTKYTAVSMYPLLLAALLIHDLPRWRADIQMGYSRKVLREMAMYIKYIVVVVMVSIVVINVGFLFNRSFTPFNEYGFRSDLFKSMKLDVRVPTPFPFLEGFDWVISREREGTGDGYGKIYMLGELRTVGFNGYYFVATLLKMPIATQLILLATFLIYFWKIRYRQSLWRNEIFLFLPILFYTIYYNFFFNAQIGIRYYIIVFPLLYIFAGSLFEKWEAFSRIKRITAFMLGLYLLASTLSYYPNYLGYFNEIVWNRMEAYKYLADSNLDWGQDDITLEKYRKKHPDLIEVPQKPDIINETRLYYESTNNIVGVTSLADEYKWIRENFQPVGRIGTSYLLYKIAPEEMKTFCNRTAYCK
jgi:hypothetical protein